MLLNLHVKNFAIIDEIDVTFTDHLNIVTGETGAGKSIILGSINLALGGKIQKDMIRKGAEFALVELLFQMDEDSSVLLQDEFDLPMEDNQLIISRKIMNGKSICKVNGVTVTASILKSISSLLIDIHGQHEHQSLLYKEKHLDIVDRYAKESIGELKLRIEETYKEYITTKKKIDDLKIDEDIRLREISFLEYEVQEIESSNLTIGEDETLSVEYKKLLHGKTIAEGLSHVHDYMGNQGSNSGAGENIGRAVKQLSKLVEYDNALINLYNQANEIESLVNDFNRELAEYNEELTSNEEDFKRIENRLDKINHLKSRFGNGISDILQHKKDCEEKLEQYLNYEQTIDQLSKHLSACELKLQTACVELSQIRKEKAQDLTKLMKEALVDLNFLDVRFEMYFSTIKGFSSNGYDEAEFLISTNPGEDMKPLSKVASGGELSRIMLAIKSVLAEKDKIGTLIFDEIDVGVSGRTAQKVSEKLSIIGQSHQVLCITHLPQIAAMADSHYMIEKSTDGISTKTSIRILNQEESIDEIARILGGAVITDTVIDSAKEMKELAKRTKKC